VFSRKIVQPTASTLGAVSDSVVGRLARRTTRWLDRKYDAALWKQFSGYEALVPNDQLITQIARNKKSDESVSAYLARQKAFVGSSDADVQKTISSFASLKTELETILKSPDRATKKFLTQAQQIMPSLDNAVKQGRNANLNDVLLIQSFLLRRQEASDYLNSLLNKAVSALTPRAGKNLVDEVMQDTIARMRKEAVGSPKAIPTNILPKGSDVVKQVVSQIRV